MARAESALAVYHSEDATLLKELSTLCTQVTSAINLGYSSRLFSSYSARKELSTLCTQVISAINLGYQATTTTTPTTTTSTTTTTGRRSDGPGRASGHRAAAPLAVTALPRHEARRRREVQSSFLLFLFIYYIFNPHLALPRHEAGRRREVRVHVSYDFIAIDSYFSRVLVFLILLCARET